MLLVSENKRNTLDYGSKANIDDAKIIEKYLDREFYLSLYPDVAEENLDPCLHYASSGWVEDRIPTSWFDASAYLTEIGAHHLQTNPFVHYILFNLYNRNLEITQKRLRHEKSKHEQVSEVKRPQGFFSEISSFDPEYYILQNEDVRLANIDPAIHYFNQGWREGRKPNSWFSPAQYLFLNPDVAIHGIEPLSHFANSGLFEKRKFSYQDHAHLPRVEPLGYRVPLVQLPTGRGEIFSLNSQPNLRIAVHCHLYYKSCFDQLLALLSNFQLEYTIFITCQNQKDAQEFIEKLYQNEIPAKNPVFIQVENRGRNILPLIELLEPLRDYDLCLHVHTKQSPERGADGHEWANQIFANIAGDPFYVHNITKLFSWNKNLGICAPEPYKKIVGYDEWGSNMHLASIVLQKIQQAPDLHQFTKNIDFPSGGMFWFRPAALQSLRGLLSYKELFASEPLPDDGTIVHAIERVLFHISSSHGYYNLFIKKSNLHTATRADPMLRRPKISVVVPILNSKPYLHQAIESLLDQSLSPDEFEVLLIDNGSTDGSTEVSSFYADLYPHISIHVATEPGAGNARNRGVQLSSGNFVTFFDADDYMDRNSLQDLLSTADGSEADIVVSQLQMFDEASFTDPLPRYPFKSGERVLQLSKYTKNGTDLAILSDDRKLLQLLFTDFGPCAKLYRKNLLTDLQLKFKEGANYEDNGFIFKCYLSCDKIAFLFNTSYYYRKMKSHSYISQSSKIDPISMLDKVQAVEEIIEMLENITNKEIQEVIKVNLLSRLEETHTLIQPNNECSPGLSGKIRDLCMKINSNIHSL